MREASKAALKSANQLQGVIWSEAVAACGKDSLAPVPVLVLPALNEMIDITTGRAMAMNRHPPRLVYGMPALR